MGHFKLAIAIIKADIRKLRKKKPRNEHNIERARIVLDSLRYGEKLEKKQ